MLRAFGQLPHNISQHDPTMLQDVALKCCVRLLGLKIKTTCPLRLQKKDAWPQRSNLLKRAKIHGACAFILPIY